MKQPDYAWALQCWREMMAKYRAGPPSKPKPRRPFTEPDAVGCWYEDCAIPHCDCEERNALLPLPSTTPAGAVG